MALFNPQSSDVHRIDLPPDLPGVEPGDWVEINAVYNADVNRRISLAYTRIYGPDKGPFDFATVQQATLEVILVRWSAPEAINAELIGKMDPAVRNFLTDEFDRLREGRTDAEKNASSGNSIPGPEPVTANSPKSSAT